MRAAGRRELPQTGSSSRRRSRRGGPPPPGPALSRVSATCRAPSDRRAAGGAVPLPRLRSRVVQFETRLRRPAGRQVPSSLSRAPQPSPRRPLFSLWLWCLPSHTPAPPNPYACSDCCFSPLVLGELCWLSKAAFVAYFEVFSAVFVEILCGFLAAFLPPHMSQLRVRE